MIWKNNNMYKKCRKNNLDKIQMKFEKLIKKHMR